MRKLERFFWYERYDEDTDMMVKGEPRFEAWLFVGLVIVTIIIAL